MNPDTNWQQNMTGSNDGHASTKRRCPAEYPDSSQPPYRPPDEMAGLAAWLHGARQTTGPRLEDSDAARDVEAAAGPQDAVTPDPPLAPYPATERDGFTDQSHPAAAAPMRCPECGEPATNRVPVDLVPWEARGMHRPQWSHPDGSALCPVPGRSGGFQPAEPAAARQPKSESTRLDPPPSMRHRWPSPPAAREPETG